MDDGILEIDVVISKESKIDRITYKQCPLRLQETLKESCLSLAKLLDCSAPLLNGVPQFGRIPLRIKMNAKHDTLLVQVPNNNLSEALNTWFPIQLKAGQVPAT